MRSSDPGSEKWGRHADTTSGSFNNGRSVSLPLRRLRRLCEAEPNDTVSAACAWRAPAPGRAGRVVA